MSDTNEIKIVKINSSDEFFDECEEQWVYITDESDLMGVDASRDVDEGDDWRISISVSEFIRDEALASTLHSSILKALEDVDGVDAVEQEDREVWLVEGSANATALISACVIQLKLLYPQLRTAYDAVS
jgi:hypothetical protein